MRRFEFIGHTADVGIKVWGRTIEELYSNAAYAMFSIMVDTRTVGETLHEPVEVESRNSEELLVEWLRELLYLASVKGKLFKRFEIEALDGTHLKALCHGEVLEIDRHEMLTEVKTVTYHGLYIAEIEKGWEAQVIFDT
jgi:SHS2 domain-containing protein